jgi:hypothetical protein
VFGALLGLEALSQLRRFDAGPAHAFFGGSAQCRTRRCFLVFLPNRGK